MKQRPRLQAALLALCAAAALPLAMAQGRRGGPDAASSAQGGTDAQTERQSNADASEPPITVEADSSLTSKERAGMRILCNRSLAGC